MLNFLTISCHLTVFDVTILAGKKRTKQFFSWPKFHLNKKTWLSNASDLIFFMNWFLCDELCKNNFFSGHFWKKNPWIIVMYNKLLLDSSQQTNNLPSKDLKKCPTLDSEKNQHKIQMIHETSSEERLDNYLMLYLTSVSSTGNSLSPQNNWIETIGSSID